MLGKTNLNDERDHCHICDAAPVSAPVRVIIQELCRYKWLVLVSRGDAADKSSVMHP